VTEDNKEEKLHWIVMFRVGSKLYPYMYRSVPEMALVAKGHFDRYGVYPHRMWVIVDDEVQKVVIT
jgi:hypothetical protein